MNDAESMKPILKESYSDTKKKKRPRFSKLLETVRKNSQKPVEEVKKKKN